MIFCMETAQISVSPLPVSACAVRAGANGLIQGAGVAEIHITHDIFMETTQSSFSPLQIPVFSIVKRQLFRE